MPHVPGRSGGRVHNTCVSPPCLLYFSFSVNLTIVRMRISMHVSFTCMRMSVCGILCGFCSYFLCHLYFVF